MPFPITPATGLVCRLSLVTLCFAAAGLPFPITPATGLVCRLSRAAAAGLGEARASCALATLLPLEHMPAIALWLRCVALAVLLPAPLAAAAPGGLEPAECIGWVRRRPSTPDLLSVRDG